MELTKSNIQILSDVIDIFEDKYIIFIKLNLLIMREKLNQKVVHVFQTNDVALMNIIKQNNNGTINED